VLGDKIMKDMQWDTFLQIAIVLGAANAFVSIIDKVYTHRMIIYSYLEDKFSPKVIFKNHLVQLETGYSNRMGLLEEALLKKI
jgi:hypothetical protein